MRSTASQTYTQRPPLAIAESLIGNVVRTGTPIAVVDVRQHAQYQCLEMARQEGLCSLLSVPLKTNTRVIGVLNVYTAERRRFRKDEAEFLSAMAAQSATAIEHAQLYQTMLATQERLRQSECLAALGSMSAGLAHEIRNPLHTMQLLASAMQQDCPPHSPVWADAEVIQNEIRRLTLLVEQFLDFARPKPPQVRCQKLHEIMEDTLLVVGAEARRRGIALHKHWPHHLPVVRIDAAQLKQVFLNVLLNALQAMPSGGAINVIHLHLPPLRARQEDIALLAQAFLARYSRALERPVRGVTPEALNRLRRHPWPGNVRELENTIKQAILTCPGALITAEDLWLEAPVPTGETLLPAQDALDAGLEQMLLTQAGEVYNQVEDRLIRKALELTKYNQVQAAHLLGITRNVLRHRMKQFGLL